VVSSCIEHAASFISYIVSALGVPTSATSIADIFSCSGACLLPENFPCTVSALILEFVDDQDDLEDEEEQPEPGDQFFSTHCWTLLRGGFEPVQRSWRLSIAAPLHGQLRLLPHLSVKN
jgi:hypothetical protein